MAQPETSRWRARPYEYARARELAAALGLSHTTAAVLARRGFGDPGAARRFLAADETHDPDRFEGIDSAVARILAHVERGSLIAVHGDYDVDGVCSTALLTSALRDLGAQVRPRLPSRDEGYGLSVERVDELHRAGAGLLVTVDCGITATAEVAHAVALGMDVVVTDHHLPGAELPGCPVVHPSVCGYPADLCATGVAFKLAQALWAAAGRDPAGLERELDIVALATVADLVPLVGENRALVRRGLRAIAGARRPGLRALMRVAGVDPQSVDETTLGFALAPRINAAGRLYRADAGLELMLTTDDARALDVARELDSANTERQSVETAILFDAERRLAELGAPEARAHVLDGESWHAGVIGIVASRLVERYHRPFVLVALDGAGRGRGRGSGRSIPAFDLHAGLAACSGHLTGFGGHRMAAGLEIEAGRVEAFREAFRAHAAAVLTDADLVKEERVDAVVPGDSLGLGLAEELGRLRPFGIGNPGVSVLVPAARVSDVRSMGEGRHVRFTVTSGGARSRAVGFGIGASTAPALRDPSTRHDLVARLEANEWRGAVEPRLVVRSLHPAGRDEWEGCRCRLDDEAWWAAVHAARKDPEPRVPRCAAGGERTLVDRRGEGAFGLLGDLLSTGEPLLVLCADVARRAAPLARDLAAERFGREPWLALSAQCGERVAEHLAQSGTAPVLCEYDVLAAQPALVHRFQHVLALDPPCRPQTLESLRRSGGDDRAFLHLGYGAAEVEFAARVLTHELALRPHLESIYRGLAALGPHGGAVSRALLEGDGRHPRGAALAGRCLRVLSDLSLANLAGSSGTLSCTITNSGRARLERSQAFRACAEAAAEGNRFLTTLTPAGPTARAVKPAARAVKPAARAVKPAARAA